MSFDHYNVEVRERVKCISGVEGKRTGAATASASLGVTVFPKRALGHEPSHSRMTQKEPLAGEGGSSGVTDKPRTFF